MAIPIFDGDFSEADRLLRNELGGINIRLRQIVAEAIATERERCAQIADRYNKAEQHVAKLIRAAYQKQEPKPSRPADWHYDSQGYCDNPGRGY
jgi:hypothetical protein